MSQKRRNSRFPEEFLFSTIDVETHKYDKKLESIKGEQKDRGGWAKLETMYGVKL